MNKRPEIKVVAATAGPIISGLLLWVLGVFVWHVPGDAAHAEAAFKAVPSDVRGVETPAPVVTSGDSLLTSTAPIDGEALLSNPAQEG